MTFRCSVFPEDGVESGLHEFPMITHRSDQTKAEMLAQIKKNMKTRQKIFTTFRKQNTQKRISFIITVMESDNLMTNVENRNAVFRLTLH